MTMLKVTWFSFLIMLCLLDVITCPPVTEKPPEEDSPEKKAEDAEADLGLEYEHYLKEVVSVLESDDIFRKKLEESNISEIKSGEIAKHLDFVGKGIRTRLDEIKRKEIDRLRQIMRLKGHLQNGTEQNGDLFLIGGERGEGVRSIHPDLVLPSIDKEKILSHLDHNNPNSFEIEDLSKLIRQATSDLEEIDKKRRNEFKDYEMEKEHLRRKEMEKLDEDKRLEAMRQHEEMQKKHKEHPKVHHPGNEAQLKDVWEETDGLNKEEFDSKTFFHLHDSNGDGILDMAEIEALFQKELDKVYDPKSPEDDMMERYEEMSRMREHVMNEVDRNKDKLISLEEFLESTKNEEFKKDEAWETLEDQKLYSEEELLQFEKEYEKEQLSEESQDGRHPPQDGRHPPQDGRPVQDDVLRFQHQPVELHQQGAAVHPNAQPSADPNQQHIVDSNQLPPVDPNQQPPQPHHVPRDEPPPNHAGVEEMRQEQPNEPPQRSRFEYQHREPSVVPPIDRRGGLPQHPREPPGYL